MLNYNMQGMSKSLSELFAMLKSAEVEIKKEHAVLMVNKMTDFKKSGKKTRARRGNPRKDGKRVAGPPKAPRLKRGVECYYCKGEGHWKRNCPKYIEDKKSGKVVVSKDKGIYDIHVIDIYLTSARSNTWVFDTGSVAHICNSQEKLWNKWRLARDEVTMRVGNGSKVEVVAVGSLPL